MKYITPELETDRLVLKRGSKEDYIKVYEYDFTKLRDVDGEFKYVKLDPSVVDSFYSSKEYLNDMFDWIIYLKDINEPIGNVVATVKDDYDTSVELSYNLHPKYWRNGYMTETVSRVMNYLFGIGFNNVISEYEEGNVKSKGLIEKMGFKLFKEEANSWIKNGKPITNYVYAITKDEFYDINTRNCL